VKLVAIVYIQGSHASWKTWKITTVFLSPGKVLEFENLGEILEKS